jgi:Beta-lactamase
LNFPPGTKYLYSNTGYTLLAQIVKRVSGQSLREFTTAHIFEPLGMNSTHFRDDHAEIVKNFAEGYEPAKDAFRISITNFDTTGATSLLTTVEDLARWDQNFYDPRVGGMGLVQQMLERGKLNNGNQLDYASGLVMGTYRGLNTVGHGGGDAGYRSYMIRFPDQHLSVMCLCNLATANPSALTRKVAEIYLAKEMKPAENAPVGDEEGIKLTLEQLKIRVGTYLNTETDGVIHISMKDDQLRAGWGMDEGAYELKALAENHFRLVGPQVDIIFETPTPKEPLRLSVRKGEEKPEVFGKVANFKPSAEELNIYSGVYRSEEIDPLYEIKVERGMLVLHRLKNKPDALLAVTPELFIGSIGNVRFARNNHGEVSGFKLSSGRILNFRFEKVSR